MAVQNRSASRPSWMCFTRKSTGVLKAVNQQVLKLVAYSDLHSALFNMRSLGAGNDSGYEPYARKQVESLPVIDKLSLFTGRGDADSGLRKQVYREYGFECLSRLCSQIFICMSMYLSWLWIILVRMLAVTQVGKKEPDASRKSAHVEHSAGGSEESVRKCIAVSSRPWNFSNVFTRFHITSREIAEPPFGRIDVLTLLQSRRRGRPKVLQVPSLLTVETLSLTQRIKLLMLEE